MKKSILFLFILIFSSCCLVPNQMTSQRRFNSWDPIYYSPNIVPQSYNYFIPDYYYRRPPVIIYRQSPVQTPRSTPRPSYIPKGSNSGNSENKTAPIRKFPNKN